LPEANLSSGSKIPGQRTEAVSRLAKSAEGAKISHWQRDSTWT
jgi:hypothetical protein